MLENLTPEVCVSRCISTEQELWICYEPLTIQAHSKRQVWKRLTGFLSTSDMQTFLEEHYQSEEVLTNFNSLSDGRSLPVL